MLHVLEIHLRGKREAAVEIPRLLMIIRNRQAQIVRIHMGLQ